nr:hypothetical protein [uncultured Roseateles sp.]
MLVKNNLIETAQLAGEVRAAILEGRVSQEEICVELSISPSYFRSLMNGHRDWGGLSNDKLYSLADLLDLEPRQVWVLAGILPADTLIEEDPDQPLSGTWSAMRRDRLVGPLLPETQEDWQLLPRATRIRELAMWAEILRLRAVHAAAQSLAPEKKAHKAESLQEGLEASPS